MARGRGRGRGRGRRGCALNAEGERLARFAAAADGGGAPAAALRGARTEALLVDVLSLARGAAGAEALSALVGALADGGARLLGAGVRQDVARLGRLVPAAERLEALCVDCGDAFGGGRGLGLSRLCERVAGLRLDKAQQCSAWAERPLSPAQVAYAALDALAPVVMALASGAPGAGAGAPPAATPPAAEPPAAEPAPPADEPRPSEPLGARHVRRALRRRGHLATLFRAAAAPACGAVVAAKTVIFSVRDGGDAPTPLVVVLRADGRVPEGRLAAALGVAPEAMALCPEERLVAFCGHRRGAIGPVGLRWEGRRRAMHAIEAALLEAEWVLCGAGQPEAVCALRPRSLAEEVEAQHGAFAVF